MKNLILLLLLSALLLCGCQPYTPVTAGKTLPSTAPGATLPAATTAPSTPETTVPPTLMPTTVPPTCPETTLPPTQPSATVPVTTQPHIHSYFAEVQKPTCTEPGFTVHVCACGDQFVDTPVDALGHSWGQWETTQPATTEKEGLQQRTCTRCGAGDQQTLPKLEPTHTHKYTANVVAPTCTQGGYTICVCDCGESYRKDYTDPLGHSFLTYASNQDATCTADGTRTARCERCEATSTVADPGTALGHSWGQWSTVKEPTVEAEGIESRTCQRCGATDSKRLDRLPAPHEHDYKKEKIAATCTEGGYVLYTCDCGDSYREETTEATGHSWGAWVVTVEPTVTSSGTRSRSCEQCDAVETATVELLPVEGGFVFVSWTETVRRNEDAFVTIWGTPGVEYDIAVFYKSGESSAKGLENKVADENGYVTWTWHVGGRTSPGTFEITVTDGQHKRTIYFTVLEAVNEA